MFISIEGFTAEEWRIVFVIVAATIGLCVGSFSGLAVHRLPIMLADQWEGLPPSLSLAKPRSHCPNCRHSLGWRENIPLISYLLVLRGRCLHCGARISMLYPGVELMSAVISAVTVGVLGVGWPAFWALFLVWALTILAWIDVREQILPDVLTLPLLWLGLLVNVSGVFVDASDSVLGAVAGYLCLWSVFWVYRFFTGKDSIGFGDFKLMAAMGAWLGCVAVGWIFLLAFVSSAVYGGLRASFSGKQSGHLPFAFGPFLAVSGWLALLNVHAR